MARALTSSRGPWPWCRRRSGSNARHVVRRPGLARPKVRQEPEAAPTRCQRWGGEGRRARFREPGDVGKDCAGRPGASAGMRPHPQRTRRRRFGSASAGRRRSAGQAAPSASAWRGGMAPRDPMAVVERCVVPPRPATRPDPRARLAQSHVGAPSTHPVAMHRPVARPVVGLVVLGFGELAVARTAVSGADAHDGQVASDEIRRHSQQDVDLAPNHPDRRGRDDSVCPAPMRAIAALRILPVNQNSRSSSTPA